MSTASTHLNPSQTRDVPPGRTAAPTSGLRGRDITDPEEMAEPFNTGSKRIVALEQSFTGRLRSHLRPGIGVVECAFLTKIMSESCVPRDASGIMLVTHNPFGSPHNGETLKAGDVVVYGPGATHVEHGRGQVTLQVGLRASELARQFRALLGEDAPDLDGRRYRVRLRPAAARRLDTLLRSVWTDPPGASVPPAGGSGLPPDAQALVSAACEIVAAEWPREREPILSGGERERLFLAARDVITGSKGDVDLTSLCDHLCVSAETIRLVFREFLGLPPMRYAKLHRMHVCRRRLMAADTVTENVKSVARRSGITHLGRFAVEYRRMFGEHPSETLRAG